MRTVYLFIIVALIAGSAEGAFGALNYTAWLTAHPQAIVADGRSETTVSAEVRDSGGRAVPDGTLVDFTTSLGVIDRSARTTAGVARVRLRSDTNIGQALVSAVVAAGNAVAQLKVDFLEPGTEMFDESFISVDSKEYLGYDVGGRVVDAAGGVKIYHRGLTIAADQAQIDVTRNILRAKAKMGGEHIVIERGDKHLAASALYYDFTSMSGVILTPPEEGAERKTFRGRDLYTEDDKEPDKPGKAAKFDFTPTSECTMFVKARSLFIRPGEEIKFRRANFYLDGDKIVSMPLHVEPLRGQGAGVKRVLAYGTDGLRLDVPFYYSLTPNGTGAVRLRHSQPGGWGYYSGPSAWQVDVEQEYNIGGSTEGVFALNRVTSGDWGVKWTQRREFDNDSQVYTHLDFPAHRSLFGSVDYSRSFDDYSLSLYMRGSKLQGYGAKYATNAYLQTKPKPLVNDAVSYTVTTRLGFDSGLQSSANKLTSGLGLQLYGKPLQIWGGSVSASLSADRNWGGAFPGTSVNAYAGFYRSLGRVGQLGLNYSYSLADTSDFYSVHRISADLNFTPSDRWRASLHATRGIGDRSTSAFAELGYEFAPLWRLDLVGTMQKFGTYSYTDAEMALVRAIGKQEARLVWSKSRGKLRLEFSALSF